MMLQSIGVARIVRATSQGGTMRRAACRHFAGPWALVLAGLFAAGSAAADDAPATPVAPPAWLSEMTPNGFVSTSWSYNFNRPASATNTLRVFDVADNTFQFDQFELCALKTADGPRQTGFCVETILGSAARITASAGLFPGASGPPHHNDAPQASTGSLA